MGRHSNTHTHTRNTHKAVVWPSELQLAGHDMATQHTMKRAQLYTHAQQHDAPQARAHTSTAVQHGEAHWDFPGIASLRRFREDLKTTSGRYGRPFYRATYEGRNPSLDTPPPAHPPRSVSPPPVGGGAGSGARPAPCPTPQTGGLSVWAPYTHAPQRGESNAGVEIPMMALPNDSVIASLPAVMPSSTLYRLPGQS